MKFTFTVFCLDCGGDLADHQAPDVNSDRTRSCTVTCLECDRPFIIALNMRPARAKKAVA